ncbi:MAG: peroxiredoxin family protein [Planctomycetes bacterium]|nr:peroxiredoxin family protein [Planctomycetota bacterium]
MRRRTAAIALLSLVAVATGEDGPPSARDVSVVPAPGRPVTFTVAMDHHSAVKYSSTPQENRDAHCEFDVSVEVLAPTTAGNFDARFRIGRIAGAFGHGDVAGIEFISGAPFPQRLGRSEVAAATALGGLDVGLRLRPDGSAKILYGVDQAARAAVERPGFAAGDAELLRSHATNAAAMRLWSVLAGPAPLPAKLSGPSRSWSAVGEVATPALGGYIWVNRRAEIVSANDEIVRVRTTGAAHLLTGDNQTVGDADTNTVKGEWTFSAADGLPVSGRETIVLRRTDKDSTESHATEIHVQRTSEPPGPRPAAASIAASPSVSAPGTPVPWSDVVRAMDAAVAAELAGRISNDPDPDETRAVAAAVDAACAAWYRAFAASDWENVGASARPDDLRRGLVNAAMQAHWAFDAAGEVRYLEAVTSRFPESAASLRTALPAAVLRAGDVARSLSLYEAVAQAGNPAERCVAWSRIGEIRAAQGNAGGALVAWREAETADPEAWRLWVSRDAARGARIGSAAPELGATTWIGSSAKPLSSLRGRVVVVQCYDPGSNEQRKMLLDLDRLARDRGPAGLTVVAAAAHVKDRTFPMPPKGSSDPRDVAPLPAGDAEKFPDVLRQLRANYGLSFPFVVATTAEIDALGAGLTFVVGRDGKIAFVADSTVGTTLVGVAVERCLAAK